MYICDKENNRILKIDKDLNYLMEFGKPTDATFDQSLSFLPDKLVVDGAGRVYCIADNVNKGIVKYENDGTFTGFYGARLPMTGRIISGRNFPHRHSVQHWNHLFRQSMTMSIWIPKDLFLHALQM